MEIRLVIMQRQSKNTIMRDRKVFTLLPVGKFSLRFK